MSGELKEYEVLVNGIAHTFLLSDDQAKERGLTVTTKAAPAPQNKARTVTTKGA